MWLTLMNTGGNNPNDLVTFSTNAVAYFRDGHTSLWSEEHGHCITVPFVEVTMLDGHNFYFINTNAKVFLGAYKSGCVVGFFGASEFGLHEFVEWYDKHVQENQKT